VEIPGGPIRLLQPRESSELPDEGDIRWAPVAPYWSVLWRSGVALATEVAGAALRGLRVLELGAGLGLPSLAAARAGAQVLATDADPEALELLAQNAEANGVHVDLAAADWHFPDPLLAGAPFDLVLGADLIYFPSSADVLLELLPRLSREAWIADPGRDDAATFLERATGEWAIETSRQGVVGIHRMRRR
jgi:predicted nicotinamide N-methyase